MTIEGLGKKFQEARRARNLTLDEAARMTKIRPSRLAEIEADDFSQFPSLAYAKGFLLIYGKFLDVDVTPYLDAFEDSERVTVDGYSYLQENERAKPVSAPVVPRRPAAPRARTRNGARSDRVSPMPLIFGIVVLVIGFTVMKLILNVQRLASPRSQSTAQASASASPVTVAKAASPASAGTSPAAVAAAASVAPAVSPSTTPTPNPIAVAAVVPDHPEVRKAKPVTKEELSKAQEPTNSATELGEQNRVAIRPLKRTYVRVTVGDTKGTPAFERWVSPSDGPVEFRGKRVSIRVLDREAVKITKNGQELQQNDQDVTVN
jgi:cytoskeletal protein RodZ